MPASAASISPVSRPPNASAYSPARPVASLAAASRTALRTGLFGRNCQSGPVTVTISAPARPATSSPRTAKSLMVTVKPARAR